MYLFFMHIYFIWIKSVSGTKNINIVFNVEFCGVLLKYHLFRESLKIIMINFTEKIGHISQGILKSLCGLNSKCVNEHY